jgi:hypothetical protein
MYKQDQFIQRLHAIARVLIVAAILALGITGTSQVVLAQEKLQLNIITPPEPICAHQSYPIRVSVLHTVTYRDLDKKLRTAGGSPELAFVLGATVKNQAIGKLSPPKQVSGFATLSDEVPGEETFTFTALKAGTTVMYFDAKSGDEYTLSEVPVTVENCDFEVRLASNWFVSQGTGGSIGLAAVLYSTLVADEKGHYTGSAKMLWTPSVVLPAICRHEDTIADSDVHLTGDINKQGKLVVQITFDTTALHEIGSCGANQTINTTNPLKPNTLKFTVPISGGTFQKSHVVKAAGRSLVNSTLVHVYPVELR